jgi:hypothetical protein
VFSSERIQEFAVLARLKPDADLVRFGGDVRRAVFCYLDEVDKPSPNAMHREIAALHRAAEKHEFEVLATLVERMSPSVQQMIEGRASAIASATAGHREMTAHDWTVPNAAALRDPSTRQAAADTLCTLVMSGTRVRERKRPSGRPTVGLTPQLYAPRSSRAEPRRKAERKLVMLLQAAVHQAGTKVPLTARMSDASRKPSLFVQMVAQILRLCGTCVAAGAEGRAVRLINDIHKARRAG